MIKIITTTSEAYFFNLRRFHFSICQVFDSFELHVFGVNLPAYMLNDRVLVEDARVKVYPLYCDFNSSESERGFAGNQKADGLATVADKSVDGDILIYMDVNSIVMEPLKAYLNTFSDNIGLAVDETHPCFRDHIYCRTFWPKGPLGTPYYGIVLGGIGIYRLSSGVRAYINYYSSLVIKMRFSWYADQEASYLAYKKYHSSLSFGNVIKRLALFDSFDDFSIVYYRKGGGKNHRFDDVSLNIQKELIRREGIQLDTLDSDTRLVGGVTDPPGIKYIIYIMYSLFNKYSKKIFSSSSKGRG